MGVIREVLYIKFNVESIGVGNFDAYLVNIVIKKDGTCFHNI